MNISAIDNNADALDLVEPGSFEKKIVLVFTKHAITYKWYNSDYVFRSGINWLKSLSLSHGDEILYGVGINEFKGFMLFAFNNGKMAKINIKAYETKTERKQLLNAFNMDAPLIFVKYFTEDIDIGITGSNQKTLIIHTSILHPLNTKASQGVQVLQLKPSILAERVFLLDEADIQDINYYKRNGAAVGYYLKPGDHFKKKESF